MSGLPGLLSYGYYGGYVSKGKLWSVTLTTNLCPVLRLRIWSHPSILPYILVVWDNTGVTSTSLPVPWVKVFSDV
jgi:hypothetical protein